MLTSYEIKELREKLGEEISDLALRLHYIDRDKWNGLETPALLKLERKLEKQRAKKVAEREELFQQLVKSF